MQDDMLPVMKQVQESEFKFMIQRILQNAQGSAIEDSRALIIQEMEGGSYSHFKFETVYDVKNLCNKGLKRLREHLAQAFTISQRILNAEVVDFESNHVLSVEALKKQSFEQLIGHIQQLKAEILSLRLNEVFMTKCSDQLKAIQHAMSLCNLQVVLEFFKGQSLDTFSIQKLETTLGESLD